MTPPKTAPPDPPAAAPETPERLADAYLDFWQENVACWATDPLALEKWVEALSRESGNLKESGR